MIAIQALGRIGTLAAATLLVITVGVKPLYAIETDSPAPPPDPVPKQNTDHKKVDTKQKEEEKVGLPAPIAPPAG